MSCSNRCFASAISVNAVLKGSTFICVGRRYQTQPLRSNGNLQNSPIARIDFLGQASGEEFLWPRSNNVAKAKKHLAAPLCANKPAVRGVKRACISVITNCGT